MIKFQCRNGHSFSVDGTTAGEIFGVNDGSSSEQSHDARTGDNEIRGALFSTSPVIPASITNSFTVSGSSLHIGNGYDSAESDVLFGEPAGVQFISANISTLTYVY